MSRERPKNLILIVARELASNLATPVFVIDARGLVVFFNETAEAMIGRTYSETGDLSAEQWRALFAPQRPDGTPLPLDELPSAIALRERRPAHETFTAEGPDGVRREVAATGLPLFTRGREFVGVVVAFWEQS